MDKPLWATPRRNSKALTLEGQEAEAVRRVFALHREGEHTLQSIADRLNSEGYTTKQGAQFQRTQVMRILKREEIYQVIYHYSGVTAQGEHTPILDPNKTQ